jgi:DNA-binding IclR family transcriptional regulator
MSYRKGYVLGEKLFAIVGVNNDPDRIVTLLKPLIDSLCKEVNENVMLSVIKNDKRINLYSVKANHPIEAKIIYEMKACHNGKGHNRPIQFRETQQFP